MNGEDMNDEIYSKRLDCFVTFDHLKPAVVNSCIGMLESCIQKTEGWRQWEGRKKGYKMVARESMRQKYKRGKEREWVQKREKSKGGYREDKMDTKNRHSGEGRKSMKVGEKCNRGQYKEEANRAFKKVIRRSNKRGRYDWNNKHAGRRAEKRRRERQKLWKCSSEKINCTAKDELEEANKTNAKQIKEIPR